MKKYTHKFTVFTPTYNRAKLLNGVFKSLMKQTFKDFEWVIVDDGSTDKTKEVIEDFMKRAWFPIRYIYKENGGKHTAINRGIKAARGELFLIFDSDDECVKNALERFYYHWGSLNSHQKKEFSSIVALVQNTKKDTIGKKFPTDIIDSNFIDIHFKHKIIGDKWILIKTDILKEYSFQEYENEKYIAESSVWFEIAKKYRARFINESLLIANYQTEGLSAKSIHYRKASPYGSTYTYSQEFHLNIPLKYKIKSLINCFRFAIYKRETFLFCIRRLLNKSEK